MNRLAYITVLIALLATGGCTKDAAWTKASEEGRIAYEDGRYWDAAQKYEMALQEARKFSAQDPRLLTALENLGLVYQMLGRYQEAEPLYQKIWELRREAHGDKHPSVAEAIERLAGVYEAEEKYADAEKLYDESLRIQRATLGPAHPSVAQTLQKRAAVLRMLNRLAEADAEDADARSIRAQHTQATAAGK